MVKWIKNLFKSSNKQLIKPVVIHSITCGERDKDGFADAYVNGEKTHVRLLLWDKEYIERLQKIGEEIHNKNSSKFQKGLSI